MTTHKIVAQEHICTVRQNRWMAASVFELTFDSDKQFESIAGHFISIIIPGKGPQGRDLRRAYSIASPPEKKPVELCIRFVENGVGTQYLKNLKPGETFKAFGPYGDFTLKDRPGRGACFIATGTGIAPFRAIITSRAYMLHPPISTLCIAGARNEDEILYEEELWAAKNVKWVPIVSQPTEKWTRTKGRVTDYLRSMGNDFAWTNTEYYLCGNGAMISEVKTILAEKGVQKTSIHQEVYYTPKP